MNHKECITKLIKLDLKLQRSSLCDQRDVLIKVNTTVAEETA